MSPDKLIYMANQIATFFDSMPEAKAIEGVALHINDNWEPRMRRQLFQIIDAGGAGLRPLVLQSASLIRRPIAA
ncbi:formate dehydrogenase subunit delta [Rhodobacter ferrooxidans]|uniref:NAD-dependent formate dehydrogenase, delta subunit protein n=1 Tax=Rhodobacter ferrooxidans TaxID=371731 RepID=C8S2Z8_9RHOB|nr:formate dehydrogenase subunit delta [Rhodobacter sp. SW2]EEW24638.1 NAD-dependent formate dehydrogenase, delta subunit protein [Rhodobacter sp. SW2]